MIEQVDSMGVPAHFYGPLNFHYTLAIGISYGHWCGGGDASPQTFVDRCKQGERRYRKRRGGGWDPRSFGM